MDDSEFTDSEVVHLNPVESMPQTIGQLLQIKREEFGVDLREAAGYLNIRYTYLLAIEEGRVDELPGAAYAMGFVRTYADYLGLDGPAIVERYKDETAELADDIRLVFPSPLPEGKVPSGTIILVAILSLVLVYAGWAIFAQQNVKLAELVPALPERFVSLLNSDKPGEGSEPAVEARTETASDASKPSAIEVTPPTPPVSVSLPAETPPTESAVPAKAAGAPAPSNVAIAETPAAAQSEPVRIPTETVPAVDESVPGVVNSEPKTVIRPGAVAVASAAESVSESGVETPVSTPELAGSQSAPSATIVAPVETTSAAGSSAATEIMPQVTEPQASTIVPVDQVDTPTIPAATTAAETQHVQAAAPLPPKPPAVASAAPRQYGSEDGVSRVVIKARIDSWVQIRDPDGEKLLTRVLRAGDSFRVPDKPGLLMETGNAGGLEISVDGTVIPDIGPKGAVRRDVALDAAILKSGTSR